MGKKVILPNVVKESGGNRFIFVQKVVNGIQFRLMCQCISVQCQKLKPTVTLLIRQYHPSFYHYPSAVIIKRLMRRKCPVCNLCRLFRDYYSAFDVSYGLSGNIYWQFYSYNDFFKEYDNFERSIALYAKQIEWLRWWCSSREKLPPQGNLISNDIWRWWIIAALILQLEGTRLASVKRFHSRSRTNVDV